MTLPAVSETRSEAVRLRAVSQQHLQHQGRPVLAPSLPRLCKLLSSTPNTNREQKRFCGVRHAGAGVASTEKMPRGPTGLPHSHETVTPLRRRGMLLTSPLLVCGQRHLKDPFLQRKVMQIYKTPTSRMARSPPRLVRNALMETFTRSAGFGVALAARQQAVCVTRLHKNPTRQAPLPSRLARKKQDLGKPARPAPEHGPESRRDGPAVTSSLTVLQRPQGASSTLT